jgi:hypothetical protein
MQRIYNLLELFEEGHPMADVLDEFKSAFIATDHVPEAIDLSGLTDWERRSLVTRIQNLQGALNDYTRDVHEVMAGLAGKIHLHQQVLPARLAYTKAKYLTH